MLKSKNPTISSDLGQWSREWSDDWLCAAVESRLNTGDPWQHVVALGMAARLERRAPIPGGVQAWLRGEVEVPQPKALMWGKGQSPELLQTMERWALRRVEALGVALTGLEESRASPTESWRREVLEGLLERDLLEGVLVILVEGGAGECLRRRLSALDVRGRHFIDVILRFPIEDEQLSRALDTNPVSWWTAPVLWG